MLYICFLFQWSFNRFCHGILGERWDDVGDDRTSRWQWRSGERVQSSVGYWRSTEWRPTALAIWGSRVWSPSRYCETFIRNADSDAVIGAKDEIEQSSSDAASVSQWSRWWSKWIFSLLALHVLVLRLLFHVHCIYCLDEFGWGSRFSEEAKEGQEDDWKRKTAGSLRRSYQTSAALQNWRKRRKWSKLHYIHYMNWADYMWTLY